MTVSVALCTYNGEKFLSRQLQTLAEQSRLPDEVVACDDASTDATLDMLRDFAAHAPFRMRVLESAQNQGVMANFDRAIAACEGDLIALCDQDDVWLPHKIATLAQIMEGQPGVALAFSDAHAMDEEETPLSERLWAAHDFDNHNRERVQHGKAFQVMIANNVVTGATMMLRARYKPLLLPLPLGSPLLHDAWLAMCLSAVSPVVAVPEPLINYRLHAGQQVGFLRASDNSRAFRHRYLNVLQQLHDRLRECGPAFDDGHLMERLPLLEARLAHLERRLNLPPLRPLRLVPVVREWLGGGYGLHSNGWRSAARDLLR